MAFLDSSDSTGGEREPTESRCRCTHLARASSICRHISSFTPPLTYESLFSRIRSASVRHTPSYPIVLTPSPGLPNRYHRSWRERRQRRTRLALGRATSRAGWGLPPTATTDEAPRRGRGVKGRHGPRGLPPVASRSGACPAMACPQAGKGVSGRHGLTRQHARRGGIRHPSPVSPALHAIRRHRCATLPARRPEPMQPAALVADSRADTMGPMPDALHLRDATRTRVCA